MKKQQSFPYSSTIIVICSHKINEYPNDHRISGRKGRKENGKEERD